MKTPPVFNWVEHVYQRSDETKRSLQRLAARPIGRSLRSTYRICAELAYREIDFPEALDQIERRLSGYSQEAARSIIPAFYEELTRRQLITVPDYKGDAYPYPIGRSPDNSTLTIPVKPTFIAFEAGRLLPVFVLGWRRVDFTYPRMRLISAILQRSVLAWQEFQGSDALVMTFESDRWSDKRLPGSWYTSMYADMTDQELQSHLDRYVSALHEVIADIER